MRRRRIHTVSCAWCGKHLRRSATANTHDMCRLCQLRFLAEANLITPLQRFELFVRRVLTHGLFFVALTFGFPSEASSQVTMEATLDQGFARVTVTNPARDVPVDVTLQVRRWTWGADSAVILTDTVAATITPREFRLAPRERQTVRLLVREDVTADSLLRVETLFTRVEDADTIQARRGIVARLDYRLRMITKLFTPEGG